MYWGLFRTDVGVLYARFKEGQSWLVSGGGIFVHIPNKRDDVPYFKGCRAQLLHNDVPYHPGLLFDLGSTANHA